MRKLLALGVILLFSALAFAGSADASHEKYTIRYVGGGASGFGVLLAGCIDKEHGLGGTCFMPCPHGTCDITVVDDYNGKDIWFRVQVDDEHFFRPQHYKHEASIEGSTVRVALFWNDATTGTITIE